MTATWENLGFTPAPSDLRGQLKGPINNGLIATTAIELDRNELGTVNCKKVPSQLVERGLIEQTRQAGIAYSSKICSLYRFTDCNIVNAPTERVKGKRASLGFRKWRTPQNSSSAHCFLRRLVKSWSQRFDFGGQLTQTNKSYLYDFVLNKLPNA